MLEQFQVFAYWPNLVLISWFKAEFLKCSPVPVPVQQSTAPTIIKDWGKLMKDFRNTRIVMVGKFDQGLS